MTWQVKVKSEKDKGKPGSKANPLPATLAKDKFFKPKKKEEKKQTEDPDKSRE